MHCVNLNEINILLLAACILCCPHNMISFHFVCSRDLAFFFFRPVDLFVEAAVLLLNSQLTKTTQV